MQTGDAVTHGNEARTGYVMCCGVDDKTSAAVKDAREVRCQRHTSREE